ncbi:discoidin domain-containing protein [Actinoplanes sp. L3-i22]|uniref:discoidin domain-containing protein n=1 Tax=Actinoplanes sp. L3-i22 TaxID=2836373 RepID=UPI001C75B235|nr:discoidin domain-containing protein [Actinoplanes sp. L3-i22]BCY08039.1 hypothetical protein L3i22_031270 [Actinoplanes sp. L3-i22]
MIRLAALLLVLPGGPPSPPPTGGLTVEPPTPAIMTGQCNGRDVTINLKNPTPNPIYAYGTLTAPAELHLPRSLIATWLPPGYTRSVPVAVTAPTGTRPGTYHLTVASRGETVDVPVTVTDPPAGAGLIRLASTVTASSARAGGSACAAVDGDAGTMWTDATGKRWPDWWQLDWPAPHTISRVEVVTTRDRGLRDWDVQVALPGGWVTVTSVRENALDRKMSVFAPRRTTGVRIVTLAGNAVNDQSRLVEVVIPGR